LGTQRVEIAMLVTPDGHSRPELSRFLTPPAVADHRTAPVNALGYLRVMFTWTTSTRRSSGSALVARSSSAKWCSTKRRIGLCYIRGPEGLLIGLAEELRAGDPA
jgi:hypothetical protein